MRTWPALDLQRADPDTTDLIEAFLIDFAVAAIDDNSPDAWRVFFHQADDRDRAASAVAHRFPGLLVQSIDVPDQDWAARSQAALRAVQVGQVIVAPPWDLPGAGIRDSGSRIRVVVIQPSMGFGTGHHATTRLCLAALQELNLRGLRVMDVGTGSGVLAIAASLLGADDVVGIDDDADALMAARENLELNPTARATFERADFRECAGRSFDVVVANLTGGLLIAACANLRALTAATGRLVISGLLVDEEPDVRRAFSDVTITARAQEDEWIAMTLAARTSYPSGTRREPYADRLSG